MTAPIKPTIDECSKDPEAPHGFDRNASHSEGRYVCECEHHEAHKAIMEAKRPEPVAVVTYSNWNGISIDALPEGRCLPVETFLYGPDLLDYADRMAAERDEALKALDEAQSRLAGIADTISSARRNVNPFDDPRLDYLGDDMRAAIWTLSYTANQHKARAETAERQLAKLRSINERVSVCSKHTGDIVDGDCVVCELAELCERHEALVKRLREPTQEMLDAGDDLLEDTVECAHNVWNAMSAVALREGEE